MQSGKKRIHQVKSKPIESKIAWSNGVVSYKEPRYTRSVRLDMAMMSLDEQLNHTQTLSKFTNKELPLHDVERLQKQEELMYVCDMIIHNVIYCSL